MTHDWIFYLAALMVTALPAYGVLRPLFDDFWSTLWPRKR